MKSAILTVSSAPEISAYQINLEFAQITLVLFAIVIDYKKEEKGNSKNENMNRRECLDVLPVFYWQGERTQNRQ